MIVIMRIDIAGPNKSFNQFAKNATGNVVCFSPSCTFGIGIKNKIIPMIDIDINFILPFIFSCLL